MGSKTFRTLHDFQRHGMDLWVECAQAACSHHGVVGAHDAANWFRVHRFNTNLEAVAGRSAHNHFRCSKCGARAARILPTQNAVTVTNFFPASPEGWKKLVKRLRD